MHRTMEFRRHQMDKKKATIVNRLKQADWFQYNNPFYAYRHLYKPDWEDPVKVGKLAVTPSFYHRGYYGGTMRELGITRKELFAYWDTLDEIEEVGYNTNIVKKLKRNYADIWAYD